MKWSLNELTKKKLIEFDEKLDLTENLKARSEEILDATVAEVVGQIAYDKGLYLLDYQLSITLTLPSSRTLKPVEYPLSVIVNEIFASLDELKKFENIDETDFIIPLEKDLIFLDESVADNILLEIPLQILAENEKNSKDLPQGKFWSVLTEEEYKKQKEEKIEEKKSPFSGLDGLFD
ncbi:YceD family protein [Lactococcus nasutitermitis]|uniref:YceD family protein n=1 Tax=Lactococcus nasutitermitis TaxID=1652957 RepID=A0ABV9JBD8_9LACT|nr:YceD family protein [Lactococcus nasutitermitis]